MKKAVFFLIVLLGLGFGFTWWNSPERKLARTVSKMLETAEVPTGMSDLGRNSRGLNLVKFFADPISIHPPEDFPHAHEVETEINREQGAAIYAAVAGMSRQITLSSPQMGLIEILDDTAAVQFKVHALVETPAERLIDGDINIESRWVQKENDWLLQEIAWTESF